jgi:hypothetical protein
VASSHSGDEPIRVRPTIQGNPMPAIRDLDEVTSFAAVHSLLF